MIRSFARLRQVEAGFDTSNLLTLGFAAGDEVRRANQTNRFRGDLLTHRPLPGVRPAALSTLLPFSGHAPTVVPGRGKNDRPAAGTSSGSRQPVVLQDSRTSSLKGAPRDQDDARAPRHRD